MGKLVLTCRENDEIYIGDSIRITMVDFKGKQVRIAISAPPDVKIDRLLDKHRERRREPKDERTEAD